MYFDTLKNRDAVAAELRELTSVIAKRMQDLGMTKPVYAEGEREQIAQLQARVDDLNRQIANYKASGIARLELRQKADQAARKRMEKDAAAVQARRQERLRREAEIDAILENAIVLVPITQREIRLAYEEHLQNATTRADGSRCSHHTRDDGTLYTISTETQGTIYVTEGQDGE